VTRGTEHQDRVYLADCVGESQAAEAALLLRQAGAEVTRDSRARWFANRRDPRGGRCGPAVTGAVQPMLPAAGLPIRLRVGRTRRRSSACAAARPGPPRGR